MATLTLTVLRCPEYGSSEQRRVEGGELTVGRGAECDWSLPDPLRSLSRKHFKLEYLAGAWQVRDLSSNGTFVNQLTAPIGRDLAQPLCDGDRLLLGDYEIEAHIEAPAYSASGMARLDTISSPFGDTVRPGFAASRLPGLDDPYDTHAASEFAAQFAPPYGAAPDHGASSSDAFVPPAVQASMPVAGAARPIVPDDWYRDMGTGPLSAPAAQTLPAATLPVVPAGPVAHPLFPEPRPAATAAPRPAVVAQDPTQVADDAGLHAALSMLMAAGDLPPDVALRAASNPEAALRNAGALLRVAVGGVRALLIGRGAVKREFRIEQTMLRPKENNPLKFAASDEQALAAMLDPRTDAQRAMGESIDDLTSHQVAMLAATQAAARALLARLEPAAFESEVAGGGLFSESRESRLWGAYKLSHAKLIEQFEDDFESAFGTAFATAYEKAIGNAKN